MCSFVVLCWVVFARVHGFRAKGRKKTEVFCLQIYNESGARDQIKTSLRT